MAKKSTAIKLPFRTVPMAGRKLKLRVVVLEDLWGDYQHDDGEIRIDPRSLASWKDFRKTLRHEMLHAALKITGVGWSDGEYCEEPIVRCIDEIFFDAWDVVDARLAKIKPRNT